MVAEPTCRADLEIHVLADQNLKILHFVGREALLGNRDAVARRRRQRRRGEHAGVGGIHGALDTLAFVGNHDGGAGDHRTRGIADSTGNGAKSGGCLRVCTRHEGERAYR